jgi:hypothetical protein
MPDYVRAVYTSVKNTWQDAENLDGTHGYTSYVWIPEETYTVDLLKIWIFAEKFRAYSKSALAGGSQTKTSTATVGAHTHDVAVGTKTSAGGGSHSHSVTGATSSSTTASHTHDVVIGTITSVSESSHKHALGAIYTATTPTVDGEMYFYNASETLMVKVPMEYVAAGVPTTFGAATAHSHNVEVGTKTSASGGASHSHTVSGQTAETVTTHTHDVIIGTVTSASGGGSHTHDVTIDAHTHEIDFGIYEEAITGRTLSAILYDPDGTVLKDFGVVLTGEESDTIDLSTYFSSLKYGMYRLVLTASDRLRCRIVYYELCKMYAQW